MSLEKEIAEMKVKCKKRTNSGITLILLCTTLLSMQVINRLMPFARVTGHYAAVLEGFQYGLIIGLTGVALFFEIYYFKGSRSNEAARKIYIRENDERNKLIKEKAGVQFYLTNAVCLMLATVVSGYFNHIVFFTLIGVLIFNIVVMSARKLYWKKKI